MNTILTDDERRLLSAAMTGKPEDIRTIEAAVIAKLREQEPVANDEGWLPCPFCGSDDVCEVLGDDTEGSPEFFVQCSKCNGSGDSDKWNDRAAPLPAVVQNIHPDDLKWLERQPLRDCGDRLVYDTEDVDSVTHALTGDEGEDDSVTLLRRLAKAIEQRQPGKTVWDLLDALDALPAVVQVPQGCISKQPNATRPHRPDDFCADVMCQVVGGCIRAAPEAPAKRCTNCDDTGDVHDQTGEWRGRCKCPAGQESPAQNTFASTAPEAPAQGDHKLKWCGSCGEGVTTFCRGKNADCPTIKKPAQAIPAPWREAVKVAREALESAQAGVIETLGCGDWSPTDPLRVANRKIGAALAQLDALEGRE